MLLQRIFFFFYSIFISHTAGFYLYLIIPFSLATLQRILFVTAEDFIRASLCLFSIRFFELQFKISIPTNFEKHLMQQLLCTFLIVIRYIYLFTYLFIYSHKELLFATLVFYLFTRLNNFKSFQLTLILSI